MTQEQSWFLEAPPGVSGFAREHGSSCGTAGQEPELTLHIQRRTASSGTPFLDGLHSLLNLR